MSSQESTSTTTSQRSPSKKLKLKPKPYLYIGGPVHGQIRVVPGGIHVYMLDDPSETCTYQSTKMRLLDETINIMVPIYRHPTLDECASVLLSDAALQCRNVVK